MATTMIRTAFSDDVVEVHDTSTGLYDDRGCLIGRTWPSATGHTRFMPAGGRNLVRCYRDLPSKFESSRLVGGRGCDHGSDRGGSATSSALRRQWSGKRMGKTTCRFEGPDCRRRVLGRRRLSERPGVSRACLGVRGRSVAQRGHGRRARGHPDDTLRGDDEAAPQPNRGGVRSLGSAEGQGSFSAPSRPEAAGTRPWRSGWTPPARRRC